MAKERGMGRGLSAILSAAPREEADELRPLPVGLVDPNPSQPRSTFDEEGLVALAESVRANGVLQPVLVRPTRGGRYELIAGERRWRAAKLAGLDEVPGVVRPHEDAASIELALVENMAREDLNPIEEARACSALVEELGLTREEVGRRVGRSRVAVSNLIRLLDLPDEALELIERRHLTEGHGRALLLADDHGVRRSLARDAARNRWSVRELESRARAAAAPGRHRRPRSKPPLHPDQAAAIELITDALTAALGRDVDVSLAKAAGYRVQISFESLDDALDVARRLRVRAVAG